METRTVEPDYSEDAKTPNKFVHFLSVLLEISKGKFDRKSKFMARNLINQWCKFKHMFISVIILDIFSATSPVSIFLQSKNLNYSVAWNMVENLTRQIKSKRSDESFKMLYEKTKNYTEFVQRKFSEEVEIELDFPEKRISRKKRLPGEGAFDENPHISPLQKYKAIYFNIIDCIHSSIEERFVPNRELLKDCSWLDPKMFKNISTMDNFPPEALMGISKLSNVDRNVLIFELKQFAKQFSSFFNTDAAVLNETPQDDNMKTGIEDEGSSSDSESEETKSCLINRKCSSCLACAFSILHELSQSGLFLNLYRGYKFVITLPCTQVTCERVFSKLKIVKHRLRSALTEDLLFNLIFMNVERDLFLNIDINTVIDLIGTTSEELRRNLIG